MVKVLPAIFSYEDMKRRFAQDNPDDPYTRRKDLETGLYALDNWLIRVDDDNKAISTVGFKEHPSHTVVGGMYASAKGREIGGNNRALQDAREPQLNQSKPLVAAFGHRDGNNARWISTAKQNGWIFPDSENWEQAKQMLPESVVNEWNSAYPNGNWAIRSIRGKGEFAKCIYLDDPAPAWFNLLKYLPDNTWDDFELGEPAPDLGTRDRFKDKNIKSKGKAEYKAFVSQQYLRQVSDRIPNAGTTLMKGWLEKLTEMNLKKGKYWFFGTNVKQDNTYVMIDVIKQGEPYTATADKKLNLEGFETAIVFTGVSKEMVGKVKRGQGIPKGRKFLDIHGKYGVRGLGKKPNNRRLPKEPKNIFPTFEKSWKDILKWRPDSSYVDFDFYKPHDAGGYKSKAPVSMRDAKKDEDVPTNERVYVSGHYIYRGEQYLKNTDIYTEEDLDMFAKKILSNPPSSKHGWFYIKPNRNEIIVFEMLGKGDTLPQQAKTSSRAGKATNPYDLAVVFTTIYDGDYGKPKHQYSDEDAGYKRGDVKDEYPMWEEEVIPQKTFAEVKEVLDKYGVTMSSLGPQLAIQQLGAALLEEVRNKKMTEEEKNKLLTSLEAFKQGKVKPETQPKEEKPETKPAVSSTLSPAERKQNARDRIDKILQTKLNWRLPIGHVRPMIDKTILDNRKKNIFIGKKQKEEVDKLLEEAY